MPTTDNGVFHRSIRRGRRRPRWVGRVLLPLILLMVGGAGYVGYSTLRADFGDPSCRATAAGVSVQFSPEQSANAATITAIALKRNLPARAATIANATAIVESKLRNIRFGDRDSLGLFQQRPSQGWGTAAEILDPIHATNKFYDALVKVDNYQAMEITKVAQEVQHSGFPEAYADHETEGRTLASTLAGHSPGGMGCRLDEATTSSAAPAVAGRLTSELGIGATGRGKLVQATGRDAVQAWAAGSWAVAHAEGDGITAITVGDRAWTRTRGEKAWSWQVADKPLPATSVAITLY
jgi:hypothetical protein